MKRDDGLLCINFDSSPFIFVIDEGGRSPGREGNDFLHRSYHNRNKCTSALHGKKAWFQLTRFCSSGEESAPAHWAIWTRFLCRWEMPWSLWGGRQFTQQQLWWQHVWRPSTSCAGPPDMGQWQWSSHFGSDRGLQRPPQTDLGRQEAVTQLDRTAAGVRADFQTIQLWQGSSVCDLSGFSFRL